MNKFIVVILPDEKKAYEALHALGKLHSEGSVTLYGSEVVARKADGTLEVKQAADDGPLGLAVGSLVGGLIGLIGGPAGAVIGFASGGMIGGLRDYLHLGVSDDFIDQITRELQPGKFAVIAEVSEDWVTPVDTKMEALGGKVVREYRDEFVDDMLEKRADSVRAELDQRMTEHETAKAEKLETKLTKRIDEARQDLQKTASKARQRLDQKKQEMNAKIEALEDQAAKAKPEVRSRIDQRIAELRDELRAREQKLNHAFELAQEALTP